MYLWPAGSRAELYSLDLTTQKRSRLTETEAGVIDYSIGSDGTSIVYTALHEDGTSELRTIDLISGADDLLYECDGCKSLSKSSAITRWELACV